ncbi:methyl-accepting chemotaxis protein [Rhodospirillum sp. A1_3_36]|uniref:methyl-accepting chemotaxis protein n=1 Tax=Rhodospirillum sp. A1_3_36 TaxID=3391666 RepID=UPI0039A577CD
MTNISTVSKIGVCLFVAVVFALVGGVLALAGASQWGGAISLAGLFPLLAGSYYMVRVRSMVGKASHACALAAGGDLGTRILGIHGRGELSAMQRDINHLLDVTEAFAREAGAALLYASQGAYYRKILERGMVGDFGTYTRRVNEGLAAMDNRTRIFREGASSMGESIHEVVRSVGVAAGGLERAAEELAAIADQTGSQSQTVAAAARRASENVSGVAAATEEFSTSIVAVSEQVERSFQVAQEAVARAERAEETVSSLAHASGRIGEVVELINDIASQTHLLALNASIEAARAGEAGKGFSVVAGEVKVLANQTAQATEEIANQIRSMCGVTEEVSAAIKAIGATIRMINEGATAIFEAVESQRGAVGEISSNINSAVEGVETVADNIAMVASGVRESGSAVTRIRAAAGDLSRHGDRLDRDVDGFIKEVTA